ncbi:MAG: hypothetical protein ACYC35_18150 [Pirellulales bacterium]
MSVAAKYHRGCLLMLLVAWLGSQCVPACGADPWVDARAVRPFVCRANFSLVGYDSVFDELAQLRQDLTWTLGLRPSDEVIELYLFGDKAGYRQYLQRQYPALPNRRALYVKNDEAGKVFAYRSDEFGVDLRHESTHALLHASLPVVPLWLDEGLAEYYEVPRSARAFDNPHLAALKWNLRLGMFPRLSALERKKDLPEMGATDYRYAWAWVHFMIEGPPAAHDELVRYLADIRSGAPPGLLSQRLERRLPGVERRLAEHFTTWRR